MRRASAQAGGTPLDAPLPLLLPDIISVLSYLSGSMILSRHDFSHATFSVEGQEMRALHARLLSDRILFL